MGWVPFMGIFLSDPSPYLREVQRKLRKTPYGQVDKRNRALSLAPPVYQICAQNRQATGGALK